MLRQISPLGKRAEDVEMTRALSLLAVVGAALALLCQTADAGPLRKNQSDPRLSAASLGVGIADRKSVV